MASTEADLNRWAGQARRIRDEFEGVYKQMTALASELDEKGNNPRFASTENEHIGDANTSLLDAIEAVQAARRLVKDAASALAGA